MDIDCGPTKGVPDKKGIIKGYLDQQTGLDEFKKFCIAVGLPRPILVSSGYGIHAYWLLEETVSRREWEPLANRLRELCVEQGLIVDSSVFEASRILRIPGTFNFKQKEPKEVTVLNELTPRMTYQELKDLLGAPEPKSIAELNSYGHNVLPVTKGKDSILFGLNLINQNKVYVTSRSKNLINELRNYIWQTDKTGIKMNRPIDAIVSTVDDISS